MIEESSNFVIGSIVGSWTFGDLPSELQAIFEDFTAVDTATMQNLIDDWLVYAEEKPCQHAWPAAFPAFVPYEISKMMAMAVGRKWAAEHPDIKTTVVCPGYCATDLNHHSGVRTAAQGAESILFPIFPRRVNEIWRLLLRRRRVAIQSHMPSHAINHCPVHFI
ncbi:hypothetical protein LEN26_016766 [Aphanomyces euteiches]|nr:hypothetical protein LEN26_016766 [Aphanomyces euteiches]